MGGYGSGTRGTYYRRQLVEVCRCIEVMPGGAIKGTMPDGGGSWQMSIETHGDATFLEVRGNRDGWKAEQSIELVEWRPRYGGKSLWLLCPWCGRKSRKLYAPPGAWQYRCRRCWKLTYWTSQNAHFYDRGLFGLWTLALARKAGIPIKQAVHELMQDRKAEALGG